MYLKQSLLVILAILGCFSIKSVQALRQRRTTRPTWIESSTTTDEQVDNEKDNRYHHQPEPQNPQYPPLNQPLAVIPPLGTTPLLEVVIVDQFDNRYPDGSYEFRYALSDGTVRSERGYLIHYQHRDILVVKGYYSYRLPDLRYLTVYYTADQNGYRQDSSTFSWHQPHLHRTLNEDNDSSEDGGQISGTENASAAII